MGHGTWGVDRDLAHIETTACAGLTMVAQHVSHHVPDRGGTRVYANKRDL